MGTEQRQKAWRFALIPPESYKTEKEPRLWNYTADMNKLLAVAYLAGIS